MTVHTSGRRVRYFYFLLLWLLFFVGYLGRANYAMALPLIQADLGLNHTMAGLSAGILFLGYILCQFAGTKIGLAWGPRKTLLVGLGWWGLFTALTGVAPTLAAMLLVRFLMGAGQTLQPASSWLVLCNWFPRTEWNRVNTVVLTSVAMAGVVTPLVVTGVLTISSWHGTFFVTAALYLLLALVVWRVVYDSPEKHPTVTAQELSEIRQARSDAKPDTYAPTPRMFRLLGNPRIIILTLVYFLQSYALWGFTTWLPSYLATERGLGMISMGLKLSVICGVALLGMLIVGFLVEKLFRRRLRLFLSTVWILGALGIFYGHTTQSVTLSVVNFAFGAAFGLFMFISVFWHLPRSILPHKVFNRATNLFMTAGQLAGISAPIIMGWLIDNSVYHWDSAFLTVEAALILAAALVLLVPRKPATE